MGKRKRDSIATESILKIYPDNYSPELRRTIERSKRQNRMRVLKDKRTRCGLPNTPNVQPESFLSRCTGVHGSRTRRSLFQSPMNSITNCRSERLDVDEYDNMFNLDASDSDSDHSVNGITFDNPNNQDEDVEMTRKYFEPLKLGGPSQVCDKCNAFVWIEERNRKNRLRDPKFSICCQNGKVTLPLLQQPPLYLQQLMNFNGGTESKKFKENIRRYNSMFSMTSMGGKIDKSVNTGGGPYIFKINGQNHHKIGSLVPNDEESTSRSGHKPKFAQLYIYDTEHEAQNRLNVCSAADRSTSLSIDVVHELIKMFDETNELIKVFRTARDKYMESEVVDMRIKLIGIRSKDARQYNLPTSNEIAALLIGNEGEEVGHRDIIVEKKSGALRRITELHPSYMAMQYPILFPYGEDGYRTEILHSGLINAQPNKRNTVSMREYYAFRIQHRSNEGHTLLKAGRLFQQFIVDAYTCIEEERLQWVRNNQKTIRSDLYKGLRDAVIQGDNHAGAVGKRLVLPATFTGGPRYMVQNFQDAMAICRWAGAPDLFITVTCNPKWSEITESLKSFPGQKADDRPDIVTRVFKIKLDLIMDEFCVHNHFGKVRAAIYTIEFQKRGLPHAHILLFLDKVDKPDTSSKINKIISAELPDKETDPLAYNSVLEFMIHGPHREGEESEKGPCMENGHCSKHYPKSYSNETRKDDEGFYFYRRRENGRIGMKNGIQIDNRWVVPHNIDLIVKYQCHMNVEACNQGRCVKYLFKYIHKGKDRATVVIERNGQETNNDVEDVIIIDEVKTYLDCRYISASESCWRIFGFNIQFRNPAVERLPFHLENEQQIWFNDTDDTSEVLERESTKKTKFLQWMKTNEANQDNPDAMNLTYAEFPTKWTWNDSDRIWTPRKKRTVIGRVYYAHPTSGERYYLRILLNHVKGAINYDELKTYNNVTYDTFKEACNARGLLDDDGEWHIALNEAKQWSTPGTLREIFVSMLMFCEISDPLDLWIKNWKDMSDDILYKRKKILNNPTLTMTDEEIQNAALCEIEILLIDNNSSLKYFSPMPLPDMTTHYHVNNRLVQEELDYNQSQLETEFSEYHESLNEEQKFVFDKVIHAVENKKGGLFFVYGSGGTGKTFLWKTILSKLRSNGKIVLAVASSGIASLLLPGGRTAHSRFKIPLEVDDYSTCNISQKTDLAQLIRRADLIIWDEAPMNHRNIFEAVDKTFQDLMRHENGNEEGPLFGGKTMLLGGDFRQTLPVVQKGSREDVVAASISKSPIWSHCNVFVLKKNMRLRRNDLNPDDAKEIEEFSEWVLNLGEGKLPTKAINEFDEPTWIKIPEDLLIESDDDPIQKIIETIYPDVSNRFTEPDYLKDRCILTPTNDCADNVNKQVLSRIHTASKIYTSADTISPLSESADEQYFSHTMEFLNGLEVSGVPNHLLELKVGIPVMLMRNIRPSKGLCNGTRLIVTELESKVIRAKIITGSRIGDDVTIHRIIASSAPAKWEFILRRRQFPLKVCFAMTINKSQGQTLQNVGIYLPRPVFSHGQLYVAVSRTTSRKGLKILIDRQEDEPPGHTKNIVYHEIFNGLPTGTSTNEDSERDI